ncbi:peptidase family M28 [Diplocarpon rosae]|nr:peptidase family M28 [Diplocarpon rosae]
MHLTQYLGAFAASFQILVSAHLAPEEVLLADRLLKIRPDADVLKFKEVDKYTRADLVSFGFIDVTEIDDPDVLNALSGVKGAPVERQTWAYPQSLTHVNEANNLIKNIKLEEPKENLKHLTGEYFNRYYNSDEGYLASEWLWQRIKSATDVNINIHLRKHHHSWKSPTIIVTIPGSSRDLVIVGANYDSVGSYNSAEYAPGADSNGSGTVTILEALRVLAHAGFQPQRTLEFHFYSGTEGGLRGSGEVSAALVSGKTYESWGLLKNTAYDTYYTVDWFSILAHIQLTLGFLVEASYDDWIE